MSLTSDITRAAVAYALKRRSPPGRLITAGDVQDAMGDYPEVWKLAKQIGAIVEPEDEKGDGPCACGHGISEHDENGCNNVGCSDGRCTAGGEAGDSDV